MSSHRSVNIKDNVIAGAVIRGITTERSNVNINGNTVETTLDPFDGSVGSFQGILVQNFSARDQQDVNVADNTVQGASGFSQGIRVGASGRQILSNILIQHNTIQSNNIGVQVRASAAGVLVNNNEISGNSTYGVQNTDAAMLDATLNCWTDATGTYHAVINATGAGDEVSDGVDIYPWYLDCTLTTLVDLPVHNVTQDIYYYTIQSAIDAAASNDQIVVATGTFVEQLEITIPLTITGSGEGCTIIQSPDTLTLFFATSNNNYPIVYLHDVSGVVIEELTVDGAGKRNANYQFQGIGLRNAGATVQNVTLINVMETPFSGAQHGVALYVYNTDGTDRDVNVLGCTFTDYQKNAMAINGENAIARVENCTTIGAGDTTVTAQNGIQFWAASGIIKNNTVKDMRYTGPSWSASGILGYGARGPESITIEDNTVENCQGAIQVYYYNGDVNVVDNNCAGNDFSYLFAFDTGSVSGNNFNGCGEGLYLADVTNITLSGNTFNDCNTGMIIDGASDVISATNCEFNDSNTGILVIPYETDNPDNVTIECSQITGNADFGIQNDSSNEVDAENNWWGDASGPSGAGGGIGDAVSANVDFFPWLLSTDCEDATVVVADYVVDDDWVDEPDWATVDVEGTDYYIGLNAIGLNAFDTIQGAIDAASDGNSIRVADGNYPENLVINKSLKITGAGGETSTIESATGLVLVSINTVATSVEFSDFTLKHTGTDNWGSSYALLVNNGAYANIHDNVVDDFKKRGIYVEGTDSSADITDNIVLGNGGVDGLQNGIVAWNSAGGFVNIVGYEVSGGSYTGEVWSGSGIMALDTWDKAVVVAENYVYENEMGIAAGDYCEYNPGSYTANVTIQGNTVIDNQYGIDIFNDIRGAHVLGNVITGCTEYAIGVYDYTNSGWSDCLPPTDTVIQYNNIADNNEGLWVEDQVDTVNAKYNFWGHATGPQDPNGTAETDGILCQNVDIIKNADGMGDDVSEENTEYCPWLAVSVISSSSPCPVGDLDGDCDNDFFDFARFAANWLEGTEP